jgi:hypothetical protein
MRMRLLVRAFLVACAVTAVPIFVVIATSPFAASYASTGSWDPWELLWAPFIVLLLPGLVLSAGFGTVLPRTPFSNHGLDIFYGLLGNLLFYTVAVYLILKFREGRS